MQIWQVKLNILATVQLVSCSKSQSALGGVTLRLAARALGRRQRPPRRARSDGLRSSRPGSFNAVLQDIFIPKWQRVLPVQSPQLDLPRSQLAHSTQGENSRREFQRTSCRRSVSPKIRSILRRRGGTNPPCQNNTLCAIGVVDAHVGQRAEAGSLCNVSICMQNSLRHLH